MSDFKDNTIALGIDIGGSHITAALVNLETGMLLSESYIRKEINTHGTVAEIINSWSEAIKKALKGNYNFSGKIGIAMPGPFDYTGGVSLIKDQNKYDILYKLNVKELLASKLSFQAEDIMFVNDAACFLVGEVVGGAAQGFERVLGLTLGTGLGSASCSDGKVEDADLWHSPFKEGIAEDYLSTDWFVKKYFELTGLKLKGVKELSELAVTKPEVRLIFDEFGRNLAAFIKHYFSQNKPGLVVIGGNISKAYSLFSAELGKCLEEESIFIPIRVAELGEESALIGAASSWRK